jgi:hypothetical protein
MTSESVKAIAMVCQIIAGDNPSMGRVDEFIFWNQAKCQSFYATCLKKKEMPDCMIERYSNMVREQNERLHK